MIETLGNFQRIEHQEIIQNQSVGEAIIILRPDSSLNGDIDRYNIATVRELKSKESSRRERGQESIMIETRKEGEQRLLNIWGGLAEVCRDETLPEFARGLYFVKGGLGYTMIDGNLVGLTVLAYDGSLDLDLRPICAEEVEFNGWIPMGDFLRLSSARGIAKKFVEDAKNQGMIQSVLENYSSENMRMPVFQPEFSIERFYNERESQSDVKFTIRPEV